MQLIPHGPDIPEHLLQAHEDGKVVFFCGAGISYPAELPGFKELIDKTFEKLHETQDDNEKIAYKQSEYSKVIELLEKRLIGNRYTVRKAIYEILQFDATIPDASKTHEALLKLAKHKGKTKLITTNFDRIFEHVIEKKRSNVENSIAPVMPIPNNDWDAIVYLHGLLPEVSTPKELDRLVLSTGDFGLAYLYRAWAASFIAEIFRNYHVCFIGYSINDVVLSYMVDAIAAAKLMGENTPEIFAFADFNSGNKDKIANEWKIKNVTPILYNVITQDHALLHETLHEWADIYSKGQEGKKQLIIDNAHKKLSENSDNDNFIGRVLWALSDNSTVPLKTFSELNPVPSLDWLESLVKYYDNSEEFFQKFSYWLSRHLNNQKLLLWFVNKQGGELHDKVAYWIDRQLQEIERLENANQQAELNQIKQHAPDAIPDKAMRTLWRLMIVGHFKRDGYFMDLRNYLDLLDKGNLTFPIRTKIRTFLTPYISAHAPYNYSNNDQPNMEERKISNIVSTEVKVSNDAMDVYQYLTSGGQKHLPELLPDFIALLCDALYLEQELDLLPQPDDESSRYLVSISDHPQNHITSEWAILIMLVRDAWLATKNIDPQKARKIAEEWMDMPFFVFKRLAFFAATHTDIIPPEQGLAWLLSDDKYWLFNYKLQRENCQLITHLTPHLTSADLSKLEQSILNPPDLSSIYFNHKLTQEENERFTEHDIWLRLAKMKAAGARLGNEGNIKLHAIEKKYTDCKLRDDMREEFTSWHSSLDGVIDKPIPKKRRELILWLKENPTADRWTTDDWGYVCHEKFALLACALYALAQENQWFSNRWQSVFYSWSDKEHFAKLSWKYLAPIIAKSPDDFFNNCTHAISSWLKAIAPQLNRHEEIFFALCDKILHAQYGERNIDNDALTQAINHPVGKVTSALFKWWQSQNPQDEQGIDIKVQAVFEKICDSSNRQFFYGRVILAQQIYYFWLKDANWTRKFLYPLLDWNKKTAETNDMWLSVLCIVWNYPAEFLTFIKEPFLNTMQ